MKYALERFVLYVLKVISIMDQLLRKFITIQVLLRHSRDKEEVSGSCKLFNKLKFNCKNIQYLYQSPLAR